MQKDAMNNLLNDKEFRQKLCAQPAKYIKQLGINTTLDADVKMIVKKNTKTITYIPLPESNFENINLTDINAAIGTSSAGTVGTGGTISTVGSTFATIGSIGSASSVQ